MEFKPSEGSGSTREPAQSNRGEGTTPSRNRVIFNNVVAAFRPAKLNDDDIEDLKTQKAKLTSEMIEPGLKGVSAKVDKDLKYVSLVWTDATDPGGVKGYKWVKTEDIPTELLVRNPGKVYPEAENLKREEENGHGKWVKRTR